MRESQDYKSNDSINLSKSLSDMNRIKQIYRSDSTGPINKPYQPFSPAMSFLNSKQNLNERRVNEIKKSCNKSFDDNGKFLFKLVRTLEYLIQEIKTKGFEKCRDEVEKKGNLKKMLEISVENLQKKVHIFNNQKKNFGGQNSKIECEMNLYRTLSERWQREKFHMDKEIPVLKNEILEVKLILILDK